MSDGNVKKAGSPVEDHQPTQCPYAAAIQVSKVHGDEVRVDSGDTETRDNSIPIASKCPAFESGSCPFRDVKTAEEAREKLLEMPPSHLSMSSFYTVVQKLHNVVMSNTGQEGATDAVDTGSAPPQNPERNSFSLSGGCPVKDVVKKVYSKEGKELPQNKVVSFAFAIESLSLAAVMAQLAKEKEASEQERDRGDDNSENIFQTDQKDKKQIPTDDRNESMEPHRGNEAGGDTATSTSGSNRRAGSLSSHLKTGTAVSHKAAEDVHFVRNFVAGKIPRALYAELVGMLYHVYKEMEICLEKYGPKFFKSCHFPNELNRTDALLQDVDFWHGSSIPKMSQATRDYVDRLHYISNHQPLLLLAHAYTRYLGDLSGGRILARIAKRALDLKDEGLAFYHFENITSPKIFKDQYRKALDALDLSQSEIDSIVAEANVAFALNMRLFEELDVLAQVPGAKVRPLKEVLMYADEYEAENTNASGHNSQNADAKCPFAFPTESVPASKIDSSDMAMAKAGKGGTCPWPFILLHDPIQGIRDWKTWAFLGFILAWLWSLAF